jgi:hypothetical protein
MRASGELPPYTQPAFVRGSEAYGCRIEPAATPATPCTRMHATWQVLQQASVLRWVGRRLHDSCIMWLVRHC